MLEISRIRFGESSLVLVFTIGVVDFKAIQAAVRPDSLLLELASRNATGVEARSAEFVMFTDAFGAGGRN